jgi:hypothetical protein
MFQFLLLMQMLLLIGYLPNKAITFVFILTECVMLHTEAVICTLFIVCYISSSVLVVII